MKNFIKTIVVFVRGVLFGIAIFGLADPFIRDWCKRKLDLYETDYAYMAHAKPYRVYKS